MVLCTFIQSHLFLAESYFAEGLIHSNQKLPYEITAILKSGWNVLKYFLLELLLLCLITIGILLKDVIRTGFYICHRNSMGKLLEKLIALFGLWSTVDNFVSFQLDNTSITRILIPLYIILGLNTLRVKYSFLKFIGNMHKPKRYWIINSNSILANFLTGTN